MNYIIRFPHLISSRKLNGKKAPDHYSIDIVILNVLKKRKYYFGPKDIVQNSEKLLFSMLSSDVKKNVKEYGSNSEESNLSNTIRWMLKDLRACGFVDYKNIEGHRSGKYSISNLGKLILYKNNNYVRQYNKMSRFLAK